MASSSAPKTYFDTQRELVVSDVAAVPIKPSIFNTPQLMSVNRASRTCCKTSTN